MHNEIITYNLINNNDEKVDFLLKDMGAIYDQFDGIIDAPHRHEYFTIIVSERGCGTHTIDFKEFKFTDYSIHFVYPGQVHQVFNPERPKGWVMNFTLEFLLRNHIMQDLINQVYLYNTYGDSPPLQLEADNFERFQDIIRQLKYYDENKAPRSIEAIGAVLKLFFINVTSLCSIQNKENLLVNNGVNNLIVNFKSLIDKNYQQCHKVSEYAEKLFVSSDYLNKYVKSQTSKSAKEFIQERIIIEAKRLLLFTEESNKELAYKLGFEEPSHFSNFFKKLTEQTPGNFRTQSRK